MAAGKFSDASLVAALGCDNYDPAASLHSQESILYRPCCDEGDKWGYEGEGRVV